MLKQLIPRQYAAGHNNVRDIGSGGFGLHYQRETWEFKASAAYGAWGAWGGSPQADTHVHGGRPCLWAGLGYRFRGPWRVT